MDIHNITITQNDIQRVLAEARPAAAAGANLDPCALYQEARPILKIAITILGVTYPPASSALATAIAILDKLCQVSGQS